MASSLLSTSHLSVFPERLSLSSKPSQHHCKTKLSLSLSLFLSTPISEFQLLENCLLLSFIYMLLNLLGLWTLFLLLRFCFPSLVLVFQSSIVQFLSACMRICHIVTIIMWELKHVWTSFHLFPHGVFRSSIDGYQCLLSCTVCW
jgi:hypothetical protein